MSINNNFMLLDSIFYLYLINDLLCSLNSFILYLTLTKAKTSSIN